MRGGTCHSISHLVVPFTLTHSFLEYHTECESAWHLSTQSLNTEFSGVKELMKCILLAPQHELNTPLC